VHHAQLPNISAEDLQQALAGIKIKPAPGDAGMIHAGCGKLYNTDKVRYLNTSMGSTLSKFGICKSPRIIQSEAAAGGECFRQLFAGASKLLGAYSFPPSRRLLSKNGDRFLVASV
jgi:hypothetical protein